MKKLFIIFASLIFTTSTIAEAKGGFSSGGGRGGFSSSSRSYSTPSSSRSYSTGSSRSYSPSRTTTTTSRNTTVYSSTHIHSYSGSCCGGMGMAYGYNNGLLTGMIIGNMMHPNNTVVYAGGGQYNNNALLYPDGRVVNQQGYVVGTYTNGTFTEIQNGPMAAQPIPQDVVIQQQESPDSTSTIIIYILILTFFSVSILSVIAILTIFLE